jgi:predicted enzyme related to lactoylglutathione lyase
VAGLLPARGASLCAPSTLRPDVPRPKITGIAYVRVYVADLHASREFYRSVLGLGGDTMDCIGAGASCFSVNGRQSIGLAQITGGTPDNLVAEIAFATPDVDRMRQYLAAHGVVSKPVAKNPAGQKYLQLRDPEGNPIAFRAAGRRRRSVHAEKRAGEHAPVSCRFCGEGSRIAG